MSKSTLYTQDALIGEVLQGNYSLDKRVGVGGMAWVFKSTHVKLGETMAVKVLLPHIAEDPQVRHRFINEAKIQYKLKHPNIVQVTDVLEDKGIVGIVMEWVNGENLKQFLKRVGIPLPLQDIWWLMAPILDAVHYANKRGLVHRDLKPPNIMLHHEEGRIIPKVADFGIAKLLDDADDHTKTGMVMGTIKYMAPEQMKDSKNVDGRADIYSLGVMIYLMATGRLPFSGSNEMVIFKVMSEKPPLPTTLNPHLPKSFDDVMMKCLHRDPNQRYESCAEFSHALSLSVLDKSGMDKDQTQNLSPFEVQRILSDLPQQEPSKIYVSAIYKDTPGHDQMASSLSALAANQGDSQMSLRGDASDPSYDRARWNANTSSAPISLAPSPSPNTVPIPAPVNVSLEQPDALSATQLTPPPVHPPTSNPWRTTVLAFLLLGAGALLTYLFIGIGKPDRQTTDNTPSNAVVTKRPSPPPPAVQVDLTPPSKRPETVRPTPPTLPPETTQPTPIPPTPTPSVVACKDGEQQTCYTGAKGCTQNTDGSYECQGSCKTGSRTCKAGKWGSCRGQRLPRLRELCNNRDDDCDGQTDESFQNKGKSCQSSDGDCKFPGTWTCQRNRLVCKKTGQGGRNHFRLRVSPRNRKVSVSLKGRTRRFRHSYCFEFSGRAKARVTARGYYTCEVTLRSQKRTQRIALKKEIPGELEPPTNYCSR